MTASLCCMFAKTSPWPLKVVTLAVVVCSQHVSLPMHASTDSLMRPILYVLSGYILSTLLPSVVFAMPNRSQTTAYVVQTLLMLMAVYCFLACLGAHALSQYEVVSMQLMVSHLLWAQSVKLSAKEQILLYQRAVVGLNRLFLLALIFVSAFAPPRTGLENLPLLALVFVPEMIGLVVVVLASVLRELGGVFENFMLS
jgi:hypothetical protein